MKSLIKKPFSILALPELQVHVVSSGDTEKVKPGSHSVVHVVNIMQKDPKDKDAEFESFVFGSLCMTLTTQKT